MSALFLTLFLEHAVSFLNLRFIFKPERPAVEDLRHPVFDCLRSPRAEILLGKMDHMSELLQKKLLIRNFQNILVPQSRTWIFGCWTNFKSICCQILRLDWSRFTNVLHSWEHGDFSDCSNCLNILIEVHFFILII